MKSDTQQKILSFFIKNKINDFVGVPDSTLKHFISYGLKRKKILITTREEEAIGIGVGICLSQKPVVVFMQNAGFANSISTITSLVQLYKIPLIFIIGWRGYLKNDAPEHKKIGQIQPDLIKLVGLKSRIINDTNWNKYCRWALQQYQQGNPCVLVVKRLFYD